jgi:NADH-quinone oxidoreductase subunit J
MSAGVLLFVVCSIVCVAGALATVTAKNPIRGAVGLLATIIGMAGLFLKLRAEFLAAIQLIVYAGAVVVLFVFVLMLLGSAAVSTESKRRRFSRWAASVVLGISAVAGLLLMLRANANGATTFGAAAEGHGSVEAIGKLMFSDALAVFELSTGLLIVAVIGAIAVARGKQGVTKSQRQIKNPQDFFSGPLMDRDRARPLPQDGVPTEATPSEGA